MDKIADLLYFDADINMISAKTKIQDEVQALFQSFEQMVGLDICLRQMSNRWKGAGNQRLTDGNAFGLHHSPFCMRQKDKQLALCMRDDRGDVSDLFLGAEEGQRAAEPQSGSYPLQMLPVVGCLPMDRPVVRTCYAGADEILVPVWSQGILVAVIFLGQFRRQSRAHTGPTELPVLSDERVKQIADMAVLLRCYLLEILSRLDASRQQDSTGRRGQVEQYIREHLSTGPTLVGLAQVLALSPSRTSHLVRQLTGCSFQTLVEQRRLAVACDLLAASSGKIAWIASQTGLGDVGYFCRYFKRKTGMTPTAYRRMHQQSVSV